MKAENTGRMFEVEVTMKAVRCLSGIGSSCRVLLVRLHEYCSVAK